MSMVADESNFIPGNVKLIIGITIVGYALYLFYQRKKYEQ